jgi:hypothetical protein
MSEQMRENFETHMRKLNPCTSFARHPAHGEYRGVTVFRAWCLWQAALATQPQAPQGWKLVPIDATAKMLLAGAGILVGHETEELYQAESTEYEAEKIYRAMVAACNVSPVLNHGWTYYEGFSAPTKTPEAGK